MNSTNDLNSLKQFLNQLTKNEIIDLIFEYIPHEHLRSINNTRIGKVEALLVFEEVKNRLISWFEDDEFIREPYGLESGLPHQLNLLRGMEFQILPQLAELIFILLDKVKSAFDLGYLDDYREDYSFQFPDQFVELLRLVANNLPEEQKEAFQIQLQNVKDNSEYSAFDFLFEVN